MGGDEREYSSDIAGGTGGREKEAGGRECRRELRKWRKMGERYSEVKRGYNRLCERKRREEGDRWMEIVKNARREGQVWEVVNKERKKRGVNGGIKMEKWTEYFKELMGGVEGRVVRGIRGKGEKVRSRRLQEGKWREQCGG